ncbi:MAG TPA: dihydroorotate dehydrogenase electron transfer subunit [Patescibacteria group bacterium]|nr:dihydroorotate dehydrogenase electron transfer subunit [Patescibacteria group bacterium]
MSGSHTRNDEMRVTKLIDVTAEASGMRELHFEDEGCSNALPGQYIMIWSPETEEIPMSLATIGREGPSSILVRPVGEATEALCRLEKGAKVGIRGPFGNGYVIRGEAPLIVAGGSGVASLMPVVEEMTRNGVRPTYVLGARSVDQLAFKGRLKGLLGERLIISTDDGSLGFKGYASQYSAQLLAEREFDAVYTCGPELMMASIFREADQRGIPVQASLERYVKCSVGLCGSCAIGPYRVCKDGPIFSSEQLRVVKDEFGKRKLDLSGRVIRVDH